MVPGEGGISTDRAASESTPGADARSGSASDGRISSSAQAEASSGFTPPDTGAAAALVEINRNTAQRYANTSHVMTIKDKVHAVLAIVPNAGQGGDPILFDRFLLTSARISQQERYQIVEPFGKPLIYFMDKAPEIYDFAGTLFSNNLGDEDSNWRDQFLSIYDGFLRGTQCVRTNTRVFLDYDGLQISGYMLSSYVAQDSQSLNSVQFGFQLYITSKRRVPVPN
jgi:hypothetical protein